MAKQAALSIRILESVKKEIDKAAAREHRSTSSLVEKILADYLQAAWTGKPGKYPDPNEYGGNPLEMPTPIGKPLGDLNSEDLAVLIDAHKQLARAYKKVQARHRRQLAGFTPRAKA